MKKVLLMSLLSLTLVACDKHETKSYREQDSDNTGKNERDRNSTTLTPMDQSENEADRAITQEIRKVIMSDNTLSTNAKNIKIITIDGVVTLRGPVANAQEIDIILKKLSRIQGIRTIDNQLEVTKN